MTLHRPERAVGVGDRLALGQFTDEDLAVLGEGDHRGGGGAPSELGMTTGSRPRGRRRRSWWVPRSIPTALGMGGASVERRCVVVTQVREARTATATRMAEKLSDDDSSSARDIRNLLAASGPGSPDRRRGHDRSGAAVPGPVPVVPVVAGGTGAGRGRRTDRGGDPLPGAGRTCRRHSGGCGGGRGVGDRTVARRRLAPPRRPTRRRSTVALTAAIVRSRRPPGTRGWSRRSPHAGVHGDRPHQRVRGVVDETPEPLRELLHHEAT